MDDTSTDGTAVVAVRMGARVLRVSRNSAPAAARNRGGRDALKDIPFFVDADGVVAPGAVERVARALEADPGLAAVFGSYGSRPPAGGLLSQCGGPRWR